jgi:hypothetical protein
MSTTVDPSVEAVRAANKLFIRSRRRIAASVDRIEESLFRVTRRRQIAGSSDGDDDVRVCALCAKPLSAGSSDWTRVNEAVYHNTCWDRRVAKARAATNPRPRQ